jgi:hypothetical protein
MIFSSSGDRKAHMTDQESPRLVLLLGSREVLTHATTAYARAMLDKLLPALDTPDPEVFDFAEELHREALADAASRGSEDGADQSADDFWRGVYAEQQALQQQALDFSFVAVFHLLERTMQKIFRQWDETLGGTVLKVGEPPPNFNAMLRMLAVYGYVTDGQPFVGNLHKLNLISNAVKHGQGPSLIQLADEFPDLFLRRASDEMTIPEHLRLTQDLLRELVESVAAFWAAFPTQQFNHADPCCIAVTGPS